MTDTFAKIYTVVLYMYSPLSEVSEGDRQYLRISSLKDGTSIILIDCTKLFFIQYFVIIIDSFADTINSI